MITVKIIHEVEVFGTLDIIQEFVEILSKGINIVPVLS